MDAGLERTPLRTQPRLPVVDEQKKDQLEQGTAGPHFFAAG
jgi:hypothetical protein